MEQEYKDLLTRSIQAMEVTANAVEVLKETSKSMNDNLITHNKGIADLYKLACEGNEVSRANNVLLMKYLRWSIIALFVFLGGAKILAEAKGLMP
jgi:hypothetical protein